ncbi:predicted protein, partial [Nematostella vectensis]
YDYVKIYDGSSTYSTLLGTFCGSNIPPVIVSSGRYLYLKFYSNSYTTSTGFRIRFKQIYSCNYSKYLESPSWPSSYPNSMQCTWVISAPSSYYIKITSVSKSMEYDFGCDNDYIRVRNGNSASSGLIGDYCG